MNNVDSNRYLFTSDRVELFDELRTFTATFQNVFNIRSIWIGGSFLTTKPSPGDIDVTVLVDGATINQLIQACDPRVSFLDQAVLREFLKQNALRIDAYFLPWNPLITGKPSEDTNVYNQQRGYWDDWWQRQRQGRKMDNPDLTWTAPRQGYLEVIVNGYS
ncbi:hypothetical protein HMPREF3227_00605 [Corynebacterium sp. CMW7794]|nr:hypothetical protein HMPREF3227_00605 [Corynebacterium sp. CMW7794]